MLSNHFTDGRRSRDCSCHWSVTEYHVLSLQVQLLLPLAQAYYISALLDATASCCLARKFSFFVNISRQTHMYPQVVEISRQPFSLKYRIRLWGNFPRIHLVQLLDAEQDDYSTRNNPIPANSKLHKSQYAFSFLKHSSVLQASPATSTLVTKDRPKMEPGISIQLLCYSVFGTHLDTVFHVSQNTIYQTSNASFA